MGIGRPPLMDESTYREMGMLFRGFAPKKTNRQKQNLHHGFNAIRLLQERCSEEVQKFYLNLETGFAKGTILTELGKFEFPGEMVWWAEKIYNDNKSGDSLNQKDTAELLRNVRLGRI